MIVDIQIDTDNTLIIFKGKDFTSFGDILKIACAITSGLYCFEPGSLLKPEFGEFVDQIKSRIKYGIHIGHDRNGKPFVRWGRFKGAVLISNQQ